LDDARAALLASGLKAREGVVREVIRRDRAQPGPTGPEPRDFASAKVLVRCQRRHFVADVMVLAVDTWPGITILPEIGDATEPTHGLRYEMRRNWTSGDPVELLWSRVRASCDQPECKCAVSVHEDTLAAELAEAAVAAAPRRAVYVLKN
jgi:hypothetical protein